MTDILYVDKKDGKPVYLMVTPFGCLVTKNPEVHLRVMGVVMACLVIGIAAGVILMTVAFLKGGEV